jgi:hypothetical protein
LAKLRAKNYTGEDEEWAGILSATLLRKRQESSDAEAIKNLEVVASINEDNYLIITIRKDIGGIVVCYYPIFIYVTWQCCDTVLT